ncbi:MAG: hypothetical protein HY074_03965 [Deltaproteobacteria bacterium]|nr:hypothetical protein [Deltaproteobacteria bacterium]
MSGRSTRFHDAFAEFRTVQRKLRGQLPAWLNVSNELVRPLEYGRIQFQKYLAQTPAATLLRPLWLGFKRRF